MVRFPDVAAAERRLAGMSAAGRWVAAARAAGGGLPIFVIEGTPGGWSPAALDDFRRAGLARGAPQIAGAASAIPVGGEAGAPVLRATGRYLLDPAALADLLARPRIAIAADGTPVAGPGMTPAPLPGRVARGPNGTPIVAVTDLDHPVAAVRRLVRATAKPSDGIVSRWLNRPISQRISMQLLLHLPDIRPSHVTLAVAATAAAMIAAFLFGGAPGLIAGGILFHIASVLDGVDGEIARASHRGSVAGATLDTRVDVVTNLGFFVGIAVSLTRLYGPRQAVVGGTVVAFGLIGMLLLGWLARRAGRPGSLDVLKVHYRARFPVGWQHRVTEALVVMTSRDFFAFAFGVIIVCGGGWMVSWLLAGFSAIWLVAIVAAIPELLRQGEARTAAYVEADRPIDAVS